jgi:hypothetical protein
MYLRMQELMAQTEMDMKSGTEKERVTWFSMWFMASIATFGVAFFPMFHRMIDSRNRHFRREVNLEKQIGEFLRTQGKEPPANSAVPREMNSKVWAASIILVVPAFVIVFLLSRDLLAHEMHQDAFLSAAFPQRMFMPQTIPIRKYALITIATLGIGGIYWLYKVTNLYNAHFKAQWKVENEIARLMEEKTVGESV